MKALERYLAAAEIDLEEELPLFHAIAAPGSSSKVRRQGICYTRALARELVKEAFDGITDTSRISVHSLRAGGLPQLRMLVFRIDFSKDMADGPVKMPKMATLRTI